MMGKPVIRCWALLLVNHTRSETMALKHTQVRRERELEDVVDLEASVVEDVGERALVAVL
jgi:hypothetical protein